MARFGKLYLTDDSDDEIEETRVVPKQKRTVETIIISSDEETEESSDLIPLPPSPAPVRHSILKNGKGGLKDHKAAVRREATEGFLGSSRRNRLHDMGSRYDLVLDGLAENDTSLQTLHKRIPKYRKEEDSDNDSVHEIRPTAQGIQASIAKTKDVAYNKPLSNSPKNSNAIVTASLSLSAPSLHTRSTRSSSRQHAPHAETHVTKPKQALSIKSPPRGPQKQTPDVTSWNQSDRHPQPIIRLLLSRKTPSASVNSSLAVAARAPSTSAKATIAAANPFSFTSKALLVGLKPPINPSYSPSSEGVPAPPASGRGSAVVAPPVDPPDEVEGETQEDTGAPTRAFELQEDINIHTSSSSDTSSGGPEGTEGVAEPFENSHPYLGNSTPNQQTYVLTTDYDKQLYRAVGHHWAPLARMREQVANAQLTADTDEPGSGSGSGDARLTTKNGRSHGGLGHEPICSCLPGDEPCEKAGGCVLLQQSWTVGGAGDSEMEVTTTQGDLGTQQDRTYGASENISVALAMRKYIERFLVAASSVTNLLTGAPVATEVNGNEEEVRGGHDASQEEREDVSMLLPEGASSAGNRRGELPAFPASPPNGDRLAISQAPAIPRSRIHPTAPIALDTPTTEISTAATLVNDSVTPRKHASSPVLLVTPSKYASRISPPSTPGQHSTGSTDAENERQSHQGPNAFDFSYNSTAMHIGPASWDMNSFAMIRSTMPDSNPVARSDLPSQIDPPSSPFQIEAPVLSTSVEPPIPNVRCYRPTRHFLGVEPPRIPGTKRYALHAVRGLVTPQEAEDTGESFSDVDDLSESELTPDALALYQAIRFYQEHLEEDLDVNDGRKRKAVDSVSSAPEEEPDYEDAAPKKKVHRNSRKRRKLSRAIPQLDSGSFSPTSVPVAVSTARPLRLRSTGATVEVPVGISVDEVDISCIEVRQVREGIVTATALCHQCRCHNTGATRKAQCGNVTIKQSHSSTADASVKVTSSARCNKTFCERCLRGWYGFDDDAIVFVKSGQRIVEGRGRGTGIGLGIVENKWICPFCINLCMCSVCSRKMKMKRTRYAPSAKAVIAVLSASTVARGSEPAGSEGIRRKARSTVTAPDSDPKTPLSMQSPAVHIARRIALPTVPAQWLPALPTPTLGLDPIYYEATRPCTRDFPTGAPQPTAANHAPIVYHVGADLEADGLEDCFTGSESNDEEESFSEPLVRTRPKASTRGDPELSASGLAAPTTRKNFMIVTPGRRMPTATKKAYHYPKEPPSPSLQTPSTQITTPGTPGEPDQALDTIAHFYLETPVKSRTNEDFPSCERYPATVDPMDLFGSGSNSHIQESQAHGPPPITGPVQHSLHINPEYASSPFSGHPPLDEVAVHPNLGDDAISSLNVNSADLFDGLAIHPNMEVQEMSSTSGYDDFLPIAGRDGFDGDVIGFMEDVDGDFLMENGLSYPSLDVSFSFVHPT